MGPWRTICCVLVSAACAASSLPLRVTAPPSGPYRVQANRILDSHNRPYLIRGTALPLLSLDAPPAVGEMPGFGPYSASAFVTLRQRMNMNAVRLPVNGREYEANPHYRDRVKEIVAKANQFELLVILAGDGPISSWVRLAGDFKDTPDAFFAVPGGPAVLPVVHAIRSAGARQPIIVGPFEEVTAESLIPDPDVIYEAAPRYASTRTDQDRWKQFGSLSERVPVLASGLDPQIEQDSTECAAFPHDPAAASALLEENLIYFDSHSISWTISTLRPGQLITDYRTLTWTKLDNGWTCGVTPILDGIAMVVLSHLWNSDTHGIFAVNQTTGGFRMARGSTSTAYGPIMADREVDGGHPPWPTRLGNISVRITDSQGVRRLAPLLHTGGGWAQVTFIVPENTAVGPAEVAVVRSDGTSSAGKVLIADVAPGLWTAAHDGRGPVIARVIQRFPDGRTNEFPAWDCGSGACRTVAIPLSDRASTTVRLEGTGFGHVAPHAQVRVTIDDVPVPVISIGPIAGAGMPGTGRDQVTIRLPDELRGRGESDVVMTIDGVLSNVVRINCGSQ
jgi:uncharacterized protein (TIGR03437 family)